MELRLIDGELIDPWSAPLVRVFGGTLADGPAARREQLSAAAAALSACVPLAARLGVAIGVETHDDFSASSVVAELLAMIDSGWAGAVGDSHHPYRMGETPAEVYANLGGRTLLAQVKDARRVPPDGWRLVLLGEAGSRSGRCSACSWPAVTRTGSRSSGRSAGIRRSSRPRWPCPST